MNYFLLIVITFLVILSLVLVLFARKKKFLIYAIIALVLFWGTLGTIGFKYVTNQQFRLAIDLRVRQVKQHDDLTDKNVPSLPLPQNTAFSYRYSDKGATYCTTLDKAEVTDFFKGISDKNSFVKDTTSTDEKENLKFSYKTIPFKVSIETRLNPKGNYIYIDSNTN